MRKGFTLIELLLVVVIIGIIAMLALPKFGDVKERAYKAAMQNDLRNLATAQELYFEDNNQYFEGTLDESTVDPIVAVSDKVSIEITLVGNSYKAVATHAGLSDFACELDRSTNSPITCAEVVGEDDGGEGGEED